MTIPDKVKIGGEEYSVEKVDRLLDGDLKLEGQINYSHGTIKLDKEGDSRRSEKVEEMKQHIRPSQLAELSDEQKEKLRDWWTVREGDRFFVENKWEDIAGESAPGRVESFDCDGLTYSKTECLPLLSVGQMIELVKKLHRVVFIDSNNPNNLWTVKVAPELVYQADELIDALWQAVKEVL